MIYIGPLVQFILKHLKLAKIPTPTICGPACVHHHPITSHYSIQFQLISQSSLSTFFHSAFSLSLTQLDLLTTFVQRWKIQLYHGRADHPVFVFGVIPIPDNDDGDAKHTTNQYTCKLPIYMPTWTIVMAHPTCALICLALYTLNNDFSNLLLQVALLYSPNAFYAYFLSFILSCAIV